MSHNVFVYGSLLADEVVQILLSRLPRAQPARIQGYRRYAIKQRNYPATIKASVSDCVEGRVLFDLSDVELQILDDFEDEDYYKGVVTAELEVGGTADASVYLWQDAHRDQLCGEWSYTDFRAQSLQSFLQMMRDWESSAAFPQEAPKEIS